MTEFKPLTERQKIVIRGIMKAQTNREIAEGIGTTEQVVKNLMRDLLFRFNCKSRLQLALKIMNKISSKRGEFDGI
jgi:DNA-binding CsgD family transcriptional regulator